MAKRTVEATGKFVSVFIPDDPGVKSEVNFTGIWNTAKVRVAARLMEKELRNYKKQLAERGEYKKETGDE